MAVAAAGEAGPARVRWPTLAWMAFFGVASGWLCLRLATTWPYVQHVLQLPLLATLPGLLYCTCAILHVRLLGTRLAGWRRWLALPACAAAGIALAPLAWSAMDALSMARFAAQVAPLVAQVEASRAAPCAPPTPYVLPPAFREYLAASAAVRTGMRIDHGAGRVVLSVAGRSADIDGSTLHRDLASPGWLKFHNDNVERREAFEADTQGMASCVVAFDGAVG